MAMKNMCVFSGSSSGNRNEYSVAAQELGRSLAQRGIGVVYGGGHVGLMGQVADAALAAKGRVTGVITEALMAKEVGHRGLTDLRVVKTMHERKALMADLSDGFVALPGGFGTLDEFFEAITWAQLGIHRKPCGLLNVHGYFDRLLAFIDHSVAEGFVRREYRDMLCVATNAAGLLDLMAAHRPPVVEKWITPAQR
jgi:uncharacterized protein (TIGR00730 family)